MFAHNIQSWLAARLGHDTSSATRWRTGAAAWLLSMAAAGSAWAQAAAPAVQTEVVSTIKAYPVAAAELQTTAADWKAAFANRGEVRIAVDTRRNQLLVVAPLDVHQSITERLTMPAGKIAPVDPNLLTLHNVSWKDFESQLRRVGFVPEGAASGDVARYKLKLSTGQDASVSIARSEATVKLTAPRDFEPALRKLATSLDKPTPKPGDVAQLVSFDKAEPAQVNKVLGWLQSAARPTNPASGRHTHIGDYVSMIFQPGEQPAAPAAQPGGAQPSGAQPGGAQPGGEGARPGGEGAAGDAEVDAGPLADVARINNVQIEYIEGLDVLILRGRKADVDRVMRLIEQIELQSQATRPEVEIFYLRNVDGRALNDLVTQVYDQIFTARQGRVTIVPLVKPNALLLIGRKENLPAVKDLLEKLDHPVAPDTQLRVFPLNFITADAALTIVNNFFRDGLGGTTAQGAGQQRPGLGTRVNAVSDGRTNSLIVQAAPRDLEEVNELLKRLDIEESPKKAHMRVVKLRNSLADELVPVIESAIGGTGGTAGGGGGGNQQPANAPGAQTGPTNNQGGGGSGARGTSLQLLRSDGKLVESGILSDVTLTSDPRGNSIIITGPEKSMDLVEELIRRLDELPATEAQIKVFTIVNGDATQLADLLRQLFGQATGAQGGNQGLQALLQSATGGGDSALVPLRFSVDVRTNSIVASGSSGDLNVVYKVLVRLDEGNIRERLTTVYRLRNAPALEVATALQQLRQFQQQLNQQTQTLNTATQTLEREVIVVPEQVSNSLIVSATPRYFDEIRRVVEELDRRPNMVVIQVLLAEVTLDDFNEFGIELGLQDSLLFDRGVAGVGGLNRVGFPFNQAGIGNDNTPASLATRNNVAGQGLSNFGVGRATAGAAFGGMVLSAGNDSVNVLIRALQTSQRMQVLSRPQVQTLDNQPAYVQVGQQVPYITSSNQTQFGIQNQTTFQDVGVILGVTPRTSPDGMIVMEIDAVKSDLGPEAEGIAISVSADGTAIRQPIINVTRAQTTVSARSGQTVILGGLITKNQTELTRRIPYLGDVPVLGRLFRFDSTDVQRTELLIIMTPYVMRTDEHVAWLNMRESERMHWCLADVANVHGNAQLFTSSADPGIHTPVIFPDETPAPEGLIAAEDLSGRVPSTMISPAQPGDPNYYPGLPPLPPGAAPPSSVQPGDYVPPPAPGYLPSPPPVPNQSSRRQLQPTPAAPVPEPDVHASLAPRQPILPAGGPLQALPPVPQGPVPYVPVPPGMATQGPAPAQLTPQGQLAPPPYGVQPAGGPQPTAPPGHVAPAQFTPPYGQGPQGQPPYAQPAYGQPAYGQAPNNQPLYGPPQSAPQPAMTGPVPNYAPAGR